MIVKQQLQLINRKFLRYPLDIAEKDYYLALAVKMISESSLAPILVFKGGTAIHHCYLPQYRFSEDLDFTSLDHDLDLQTVVDVLEASGDFKVRKKFESQATIKIERLGYSGILSQPAEKIRASATRARYRDFYDLHLLLERPDLKLSDAIGLLQQKEVRAEISPEQIRINWMQAQQEVNDDLHSIYCSRQVQSQDISATLANLDFAPLRP